VLDDRQDVRVANLASYPRTPEAAVAGGLVIGAGIVFGLFGAVPLLGWEEGFLPVDVAALVVGLAFLGWGPFAVDGRVEVTSDEVRVRWYPWVRAVPLSSVADVDVQRDGIAHVPVIRTTDGARVAARPLMSWRLEDHEQRVERLRRSIEAARQSTEAT
jgi:hypothetical protein